MLITITSISYALAALGFVLLTVLLALHQPRNREHLGLLLACAGSAVWASILLVMIAIESPALGTWVWPLDALRSAVWLIFLASLIPVSSGWSAPRRWLPVVAILAVLLLSANPLLGLGLEPMSVGVVTLLLLALLGLFAVEQVYRNADAHERHILKPLCIATGGLFVFDLFIYSHALLLNHLDAALWSSRGLVNAVLIVPLLIGAKRHPALTPDLRVSRRVAFHSATLIGAGLYLLAMALGGYVIRLSGGVWGPVLQIVFFTAAVLILVYIFSSSNLRARLRVLLSKHFYRYKYDYRDEWLRLIATLSDSDGGSAPQRALKALANILHSPSGQLWISRGPGMPYESMAALGPGNASVYDPAHGLVRFLDDTNWIVDTAEYERDPGRYSHALRDVSAEDLPPASVIVPMRHEDRLLGFARLDRLAGLGPLNFEDHDLLKTVGRQMAVFVQQELTQERLAETRQFEAFNRMTAFLMHDLKNLIAQQALIVRNAPRFKDNPEFIDDMIGTVQRGVTRMRKLLEILKSGTAETANSRISLTSVLEEVVADAALQAPAPTLRIDGLLEVQADRDKLAMVLNHAVRNAQDATGAGGQVAVRAFRDDGHAVIEVEDDGTGMDEAFVRERLFRPFDTTKGASGMGIGAYQIREYVHSLGGRVDVESRVGQGTTLRLVIPAAGAGAADRAPT